DLDLQGSPVWLAGPASERVGGVATHLRNRIGQLRQDRLEVGLIGKMIHELKAPPPDLCVRMVEPGYQCGLRSGMYLHSPKIVGVDRPDELDDGRIPARRVCKGLNQLRASIHASILDASNRSRPDQTR